MSTREEKIESAIQKMHEALEYNHPEVLDAELDAKYVEKKDTIECHLTYRHDKYVTTNNSGVVDSKIRVDWELAVDSFIEDEFNAAKFVELMVETGNNDLADAYSGKFEICGVSKVERREAFA